MAIKLRVISDHYQELGEHRSRVFGVNGGTIGRAPDNDWILPDTKRLVSGHHCDIEYRSGAYWLSDKSTNGVFVNEADDPVSETGPVALQDGDRLRLGDYEILVSLDDRIDFLPAAAELHSAAKHLDSDIGANLDLDSLFTPRESADSGSISIRNAFGLKLPKDLRDAAAAAVARAEAANSSDDRGSTRATAERSGCCRTDRRDGLGTQDPCRHSAGTCRCARTAQEQDRGAATDSAVPPAGELVDRPQVRPCRLSAVVPASTRLPCRQRPRPCCHCWPASCCARRWSGSTTCSRPVRRPDRPPQVRPRRRRRRAATRCAVPRAWSRR